MPTFPGFPFFRNLSSRGSGPLYEPLPPSSHAPFGAASLPAAPGRSSERDPAPGSGWSLGRLQGPRRRAEGGGQALPAPRPTPAPRPSSQPHPTRGGHAQSAGASRAGLWDPGRGSGRPRLIIRTRWSRSARPIRRPWPRTAAGPRRGHTPPSRSLPSCGPRPGAGWLASRGGLNKGLCGASPARRGLGEPSAGRSPTGALGLSGQGSHTLDGTKLGSERDGPCEE
ncbi:translation initiation factor IF-2-like [Mustela erminea]|uniref:translation initiation factor IF-2-like n=1 Tax=Mustela erminea TaxID=36723 RepID=UPI0013866112|nr:translation initiation factor IF-2-like [Mustela erminea]XP_032188707.1 translation initiation factor IF-2-like [Mustela erminea]XP_032188708.1 translation initiation factor IF-2-like [Mustela erminea]